MRHLLGEACAGARRRLDEPLLARMRDAVHGEDDVEVAREQACQSVVHAHQVAADGGLRQLVRVGGECRPEHRVVELHDPGAEHLGVGDVGAGLQAREPAARIGHRDAAPDRVPEARGVAEARLVPVEHCGDPVLHPVGVEVDAVDMDPGPGVDPLVGGPPVAVVHLGAHRAARRLHDGASRLDVDLATGVDLDVEVRALHGPEPATAARAAERDGLHLGQLREERRDRAREVLARGHAAGPPPVARPYVSSTR